jgi:hypothetical protein
MLDRRIARLALAGEVRVTSIVAQLQNLSKEYARTGTPSEQLLLGLPGCNLSYDPSYEIPRESSRGRHGLGM